jgi:hypothetical protein
VPEAADHEHRTSEKGLETLIVRHMTGVDGLAPPPPERVAEPPSHYGPKRPARGNGWLTGWAGDFDRTHALDLWHLFAFLRATQPDAVDKLGVQSWVDAGDVARRKLLVRLSSEIGKRGVIDVLRKGIDQGPLHFDLFYGTPSPGNDKATGGSGLPERQEEHAGGSAPGARHGAGQGHADAAEGRYGGLQAVRRERWVSALSSAPYHMPWRFNGAAGRCARKADRLGADRHPDAQASTGPLPGSTWAKEPDHPPRSCWWRPTTRACTTASQAPPAAGAR